MNTHREMIRDRGGYRERGKHIDSVVTLGFVAELLARWSDRMADEQTAGKSGHLRATGGGGLTMDTGVNINTGGEYGDSKYIAH